MTPAHIKEAVEALGIEFIQVDSPVTQLEDGSSVVAGSWSMNQISDLTNHLRKHFITKCYFYQLATEKVMICPAPKLFIARYKFRGKFL